MDLIKTPKRLYFEWIAGIDMDADIVTEIIALDLELPCLHRVVGFGADAVTDSHTVYENDDLENGVHNSCEGDVRGQGHCHRDGQ